MLGLDFGLSVLLVLCLLCVCIFEFVNGFHDTANAVATVIYTRSLPPMVAVILSGVLNAAGVFLGGIGVAMGIINLLPVETLVDQNVSHSLGMIGAILLTAIMWNVGTWYFAIPASSSHTLIGSILGVGAAFSLLPESNSMAVNWKKASEVGLSLLCSPLFGFCAALILMGLLTALFRKNTELFSEPHGHKPPPTWIRSILIFTCGLVSFSHGSNDGQKGIGLMMLILIGILPVKYALDHRIPDSELKAAVSDVQTKWNEIKAPTLEAADDSAKAKEAIAKLDERVSRLVSSAETAIAAPEPAPKVRFEVRRQILLLKNTIKSIKSEFPKVGSSLKSLSKSTDGLTRFTDYAPFWVIALIALSLGVGTMIGWKRIVVTIGEKIGKSHLNYAQGASAEVVAASTIAVSTYLGLPVSTTHVLSSGIAGTMYASGGQSNLAKGTIAKILLAWFLTLPVCIAVSGTLFLVIRYTIAR